MLAAPTINNATLQRMAAVRARALMDSFILLPPSYMFPYWGLLNIDLEDWIVKCRGETVVAQFVIPNECEESLIFMKRQDFSVAVLIRNDSTGVAILNLSQYRLKRITATGLRSQNKDLEFLLLTPDLCILSFSSFLPFPDQ